MILCLDCGNSRLKWGLRDGDEWRDSGALALADIPQLVRHLPGGRVPQQVVGCNVAGPRRAQQIEAALQLPVSWISAATEQCGVVNCYDEPASLGADRWAALIGAHALHDGAALVVLAGTATTVDMLAADGRFRGGLILPGIALMASALNTGTAALPLAMGKYSPAPTNTHDAIASGAIHATLGAIERMFASLAAEWDVVCIVSGGAAGDLVAHLDIPSRRVDTLVLDGLARIAAERSGDPA